jgi:hypothetical protein
MRWVTWEHVGIDRMACAWLIRTLIDPESQFDFIPYGQMVEETPDTIPFDIPGVRLSHHHGHCSFITFLNEQRLNDPILHQIGRIIDGADSVNEHIPPAESEGVDAICRGLRLLAGDDHRALEQAQVIFDALYQALGDLS